MVADSGVDMDNSSVVVDRVDSVVDMVDSVVDRAEGRAVDRAGGSRAVDRAGCRAADMDYSQEENESETVVVVARMDIACILEGMEEDNTAVHISYGYIRLATGSVHPVGGL